MGIGTADAARLFGAGEFSELLRISRFSPSTASTFPSETRIVLTHALALTGQFESAIELASRDFNGGGPPLLRSRAALILGVVGAAQGDVNASSTHLDAAIRLAQDARDNGLLGWAQLALFRLLVDTGLPHGSTALLQQVRHTILKAGIPHLTAYLHICVAALEGQSGRLAEATRHCDIAESLLDTFPNLWLQSNLLLNRACVAHIECDMKRTSRFIDLARDASLKSGYSRGTWVLDSNTGHVETLLGHFERAERCFDRVIKSAKASAVVVGAYEGLARLYLAVNDVDRCEAALRQIDAEILRHEGLGATYHARWSIVTSIRWLLKRGDFNAAVERLDAFERSGAACHDTPLATALHLVAAQAKLAVGDAAGSAGRLVAATESGITTLREFQAQYYFAASRAASDEIQLSTALRDRAQRVWSHQGIVSVRPQMEFGGAEPKVAPRTSDRISCEALANSLSALIDLAYSPRLFGAELLATIDALQCSPHARLIELRQEPSEPNYRPDISLEIGSERGRTTILVCALPQDPAKAIVLADVLRIGRAALALEKARQEERSRAALWPASPAEEQAGALFLAEEMQTLLATARRIAPTTVPVLITGETGTGKEVLARMIHAYSTRAAKAFLPFNCSATPKEMLDSQLFGHRRGAFTGASEHFAGVIRAAAAGTLFLDEIGETTLDVQPKLLRFLESSEIHPLGETQPVRVDVRVIAATNADLDALLATGRFREDLFYRLNIVRLHVPPLRERRVEVPALANHYLRKHALECGKGDLRLAEETMEYLVLYRWPGNVRQLANEMRRLAALAEPGAVLMPEHLGPEIAASRRTVPPSERILDANEVVVRMDQPMAAAVQHLERAMVQYALAQCDGRIEETAEMLGLSRKGLYLKRVRFGAERRGRDSEVA